MRFTIAHFADEQNPDPRLSSCRLASDHPVERLYVFHAKVTCVLSLRCNVTAPSLTDVDREQTRDDVDAVPLTANGREEYSAMG
ncbi:hypothetical protein A2U01_0017774 [Trifolium medium]|uniref:Uncharacterized protein n=1 Tax=Trifolium medium TaxID=97028 RepID=A0A392NCG5_9FABA|nr:hypothetical protein [Trifolium medium]